MEYKWLQVSSGLPDSSEYSSRFEKRCGSYGIDSFFDFKFRQSILQALGDCSEYINYYWYHHQIFFNSLFNSLVRSKYLLPSRLGL